MIVKFAKPGDATDLAARKAGRRPPHRTELATCALFLALSGCAFLPLHLSTPTAGDPGLVGYAQNLLAKNKTELSQTLAAAQKRWHDTGAPIDRAHVGLTRGQWGFPGYDPLAAAADLRTVLAAADDWNPDDRAFLHWRVAQLDQSAQTRADDAARNTTIAHLRQQLQDARSKLRAITNIERKLGPK